MKKGLGLLLLLLICTMASATDFQLRIKSNGNQRIRTTPGSVINYTAVGELSDNQNEGLAMFSFDLNYTGGSLTPLAAPSSFPMQNFAKPLGVNNPAGFGGTVKGNGLVQIGGAQNTINNFFAEYPSGSVITGVAKPGQPATLGSGSITAPYQVGNYRLSPTSVFANVIRQGETGTPVWKVDAASPRPVQDLEIEVIALFQNRNQVSISQGETITFELNAGPANAGKTYLLLGSVSGTSPGINLPNNLVLPLNMDWYFLLTRLQPNSPTLQFSFGQLDSQGRARARFKPTSQFLGLEVSHAFLLLNPVNFVSNPVTALVVN